MTTSETIALFGTTQARPDIKLLVAGPLSLELENGAIRYVRHSGHEAIRGIDYLVRDASWRTPPASLTLQSLEQEAGRFAAVMAGEVHQDDIHYVYTLSLAGTSDGTLEVVAEAEALSTFMTNRTGFVVLHPIKDTAGRPVTVTHKDGSTTETTFPALISPGQPIFDIRALTHEVAPGLAVTCRMEAAFPHDPETIYEMEDQRNWTDASYKTYVCSLLDPWPYEIAKGAKIRQRIALTFIGTAPPAGSAADDVVTITLGDGSSGRMPAIGLGLMPAYRQDAAGRSGILAALEPRFLTAYAEADAPDFGATLADYAALARDLGAAVQLELILPEDRPPAAVLDQAAAACRTAGLAPARVLACPRPYLKSIQPVGPWPDVADLGHIYNQVRRAFPEAVVLGGMASYFTELNRKRPPVATIDAISCTTAPIVHAADDRSVMETHEALPAVIASMAAMAPGKTLHLGPSAIAMRHNPYGAATAANPRGERIAMAEDDPRQQGLYAAAWTVGYAAQVAASGAVSTLALNHLAGPSGVLGRSNQVRPVYHVMAALCRASGAELSPLALAGHQLAGLAWRTRERRHLLLANQTAAPVRLATDRALDGQLLDATTVASAANPAWRETGSTALSPTIELGPYAVLFAST